MEVYSIYASFSSRPVRSRFDAKPADRETPRIAPERHRRPRVLVVDDDDGVRFTLTEVLSGLDVEPFEAASGPAALTIMAEGPVDLVITDLRMPDMDGLELLRRLKSSEAPPKVVLLTAHGSEAHAVQAMKLGAFDYLKKPFDIDELSAVVQRATESVRLDLENARLRAELTLARHMVFRSDAMRRVAELVQRIAARDVTVMITGESGTGKERVAEAIVAASKRADRPFVRFNCAALPLELAESELFGHVEGAFTGAVRTRAGVFREAHTGTLFLDEVAELDPLIQGKLLRVLQEREIRPIGGDRAEAVDVRILAATHRDLHRLVADGRFREDLFYRLDVVRLEVPPLRARPEDVDPLIDFFVRKYAERFGVSNLNLAGDARAKLRSLPLKGNVRELEHAVERLVAMWDGELAQIEEPAGPTGLREQVESYERTLVLKALSASGGNRSEAARRLRIGRVTLLDKLKKYGVEDGRD
ncbi:MAG: sigma-54-dependent Fis family transcriptional regulator [Deltaproteobacteria bacterium]|nr:sigma-54-dependent Fis family transcriptional regulator [Deltaproteobacteria bacterium]